MSNYGVKRIDSVFDAVQIGNVIEIHRHYKNKNTYVFQMEGKKYALNGCQLVEEKDLPEVCVDFCLSVEQRSSLRQCINILNQDINKDEIIELLQKDLFKAFLQGLINEELIDEDIAVAAIREDKNNYYILGERVLRTQKMRVALVEKDPMFIRLIPEHLRSLEICKAAVAGFKKILLSEGVKNDSEVNYHIKQSLSQYIPNETWNEHFKEL